MESAPVTWQNTDIAQLWSLICNGLYTGNVQTFHTADKLISMFVIIYSIRAKESRIAQIITTAKHHAAMPIILCSLNSLHNAKAQDNAPDE